MTPWTLREDRLLVRLRVEGIDRDLISEALGRGRNEVSCRSQRLKLIGVMETVAPDARQWRLKDGGLEKLEAWHARGTKGGRRTWNKQQREEVADLFQDGLGHKAIAARIGTSASSVRKVLTRLRQEGEVGYEHRPWDEHEIQKLGELISAGVGDAHIAIRLGRSAEAVINKRRAIGLRMGE